MADDIIIQVIDEDIIIQVIDDPITIEMREGPGPPGEQGDSLTTVVLDEAAYLALSPEAQLNPLIFYIIPE
jgi:hypothetical protein